MKKSLALFLLLAACAPVHNSTISPIQDKKGVVKGSMNISFQSDLGGGNGKITAVASNGEVFNGNIITEKSVTESDSSSNGVGTEGKTVTSHFNVHNGKTSKYSPTAKALLISSSGNSMKCSFTLESPNLGITGGAIGECKISDGRVVPVSFSHK